MHVYGVNNGDAASLPRPEDGEPVVIATAVTRLVKPTVATLPLGFRFCHQCAPQ